MQPHPDSGRDQLMATSAESALITARIVAKLDAFAAYFHAYFAPLRGNSCSFKPYFSAAAENDAACWRSDLVTKISRADGAVGIVAVCCCLLQEAVRRELCRPDLLGLGASSSRHCTPSLLRGADSPTLMSSASAELQGHLAGTSVRKAQAFAFHQSFQPWQHTLDPPFCKRDEYGRV